MTPIYVAVDYTCREADHALARFDTAKVFQVTILATNIAIGSNTGNFASFGSSETEERSY